MFITFAIPLVAPSVGEGAGREEEEGEEEEEEEVEEKEEGGVDIKDYLADTSAWHPDHGISVTRRDRRGLLLMEEEEREEEEEGEEREEEVISVPPAQHRHTRTSWRQTGNPGQGNTTANPIPNILVG